MSAFDEDFAPISALQHLVYCERQCALIHLERLWTDNRLTAEGHVLHEKVHQDEGEIDHGVHITRSLPVASTALKLAGQCDVVAFHPHPERHASHPWSAVVPVEYKRGRPKSHLADQVQLCAQALCLEEMLDMTIPEGALYYGEPRRRTPVVFTPELRRQTTQAAARLHQLLAAGITPKAEYQAGRCRGCSLLPLCLPRRRETPRQVAPWFQNSLVAPLPET